jgi:hypothetical protein
VLPISSQLSNKGEKKPIVKIALLLDTSNSMDGLINQAKRQLWNVVNSFSNASKDGEIPELQIALYEYGNDGLSMMEGYVRLVTPFTNDLDLISEKLFSLKTNGGSEYCGYVIDRALNALSWGNNDNEMKLIFIAGNEGFDQGNMDYQSACGLSKAKNVVVNTIFCGSARKGKSLHWEDGAKISGGQYMNIEIDRQYMVMPTPYDERILICNDALNNTYIAYGQNRDYYEERQVMQDSNAKKESMAVAISRTKSKVSSNYVNSKWDLVDANENTPTIIDDIDEDALPEELRKMSKEELKKYLAQQKELRRSIQMEIDSLNIMREKFLTENRNKAENNNMLDQVMIKAVQDQASEYGIKFD